jgi:hypothetical protein
MKQEVSAAHSRRRRHATANVSIRSGTITTVAGADKSARRGPTVALVATTRTEAAALMAAPGVPNETGPSSAPSAAPRRMYNIQIWAPASRSADSGRTDQSFWFMTHSKTIDRLVRCGAQGEEIPTKRWRWFDTTTAAVSLRCHRRGRIAFGSYRRGDGLVNQRWVTILRRSQNCVVCLEHCVSNI